MYCVRFSANLKPNTRGSCGIFQSLICRQISSFWGSWDSWVLNILLFIFWSTTIALQQKLQELKKIWFSLGFRYSNILSYSQWKWPPLTILQNSQIWVDFKILLVFTSKGENNLVTRAGVPCRKRQETKPAKRNADSGNKAELEKRSSQGFVYCSSTASCLF